jgi:hypothetical protein
LKYAMAGLFPVGTMRMILTAPQRGVKVPKPRGAVP